MTKPAILIADPDYFGGEGAFASEVESFDAAGYKTIFGNCITQDDIISQGAGAHAILCCNNPVIGMPVFKALPECRLVFRYGVGYNSVDVEGATREARAVLFLPGFCTEELATHAAGMILDLNRNLSLHDRSIRKGVWEVREGITPRR